VCGMYGNRVRPPVSALFSSRLRNLSEILNLIALLSGHAKTCHDVLCGKRGNRELNYAGRNWDPGNHTFVYLVSSPLSLRIGSALKESSNALEQNPAEGNTPKAIPGIESDNCMTAIRRNRDIAHDWAASSFEQHGILQPGRVVIPTSYSVTPRNQLTNVDAAPAAREPNSTNSRRESSGGSPYSIARQEEEARSEELKRKERAVVRVPSDFADSKAILIPKYLIL